MKKWRLESPGQFYDAGEDTVVYFDSASGDTHLLSSFAAFLLQQLLEQPLTEQQLGSHAASALEFQDAAEADQAIHSLLGELLELDILQQD